jgi:DNA-binding CsgD family transcriptional regulator
VDAEEGNVEGVEPNNADVNHYGASASEKHGWKSAMIATEALAMVGLAACIVDDSGRPLPRNDLFARLGLVTRTGDEISIADSKANDFLRQSIRRWNPRAAKTVRSIPVPAAGGLPAFVLHLVPIRRSVHNIFVGASALIVATTLSTSSGPSVAVIAELFKLTSSEARVARGILDCKSVSEIATELGWSPETIRSYLKSAFRKTGVHRQAELVSLLVSAQTLKL